jgi:hypothetical protein
MVRGITVMVFVGDVRKTDASTSVLHFNKSVKRTVRPCFGPTERHL